MGEQDFCSDEVINYILSRMKRKNFNKEVYY